MSENIKLTAKQITADRDHLIQWYNENKRDLPWRNSRDPYRIWISEVMLQQTTVTAVRPFFEKFISRFSNVHNLAQSKIEDVYEYWAGLGYYSRARNLHKAAQLFSQNGFPQNYTKLIEYPGLGPYTSRAIASLAFNEPVGVLDGNVIRILSRKYNLHLEWWKPQAREQLQNIADQLAQTQLNADLNQALMELGATICTPKKVMCLQCPWRKSCLALKENTIELLPLKKEKPKFEKWLWKFYINKNRNKIYLEENHQTPFLKKNLLPLSDAEKISQKPDTFHFKHSVTKYEIYIQLFKTTRSNKSGLWADLDQVSKINPTSLMKKILKSEKMK